MKHVCAMKADTRPVNRARLVSFDGTPLSSVSFHYSRVFKARSPRAAQRAAAERDRKMMLKIEDHYQPAYVKMFNHSVDLVHTNADFAALLEAYNAGNIEAALQAVNLDISFGFMLADSKSTAFAALADAGNYAVGAAQEFGYAPNSFAFDPMRPYVMDWVNSHTAEMVTEVTEQSKLAIREIIRGGMNDGLSGRDVVSLIKQNIGLTERQAAANNNFYRRMLESDLPRETCDRRALAYAKRQLRYRAEMIAQDEAHIAVSRGRLEMWRELAEQHGGRGGAIEDVRRTWITADDEAVCEVCGEMDGQEVALEEAYTLPGGEQVEEPNAHNLCRCDELISPA